MKIFKGELIGFIKDGYGERQAISVEFIPEFHNNGYNVWTPNQPCRLSVSGLNVNHCSFDGNEYAKSNNRFVGWVYLVKVDKKSPVFIFPDYDNTEYELYRISG